MSRPLRISPSILPADFTRLGEELRAIQDAGADMVHVDVMDGRFVPNITMGPIILSAVRRATPLPIDVHLMIVEPDRYMEEFVRAGADLISVHAEAVPDVRATLRHIRSLGKRAAVAVNPGSPLDGVPELLPELDMVLLMTVNPGFSGQRFIDSVLPKVRALRAEIERRGVDVDIEVDGGIAPDTVPLVVGAGANVLVAGSSVFGAPNGDYAGAIAALRAAAAR
jgi:ribulose-phosphate 3-epimerase